MHRHFPKSRRARTAHRRQLLVETLEGRELLATFTWIGNTDTSWNNAANWQGGLKPVVGAGPDTIVFSTANLTGAANYTANNDITGLTQAFNLQFTDTDATAGKDFNLTGNAISLSTGGITNSMTGTETKIAFGGAGLTLTAPAPITNTLGALTITSAIAMGANALTIDTTVATNTTTLGGVVTGSGDLTKNTNLGTLILSGANAAYSGNIIINRGVLQVSNASALGTAAGSTTINFNSGDSGGNGTTLQLNSITIASEPLKMTSSNSGGSRRTALVASGTTNGWGGPITVEGNDLIQFNQGGSGTFTVSGSITASVAGFTGTTFFRGGGAGLGNITGVFNMPAASFNRTDSSVWQLSSTGNNWGTTSIATGELRMGVANALPAGAIVSMGQGGGTPSLNLNGFNQTVAGLTNAVTNATSLTITSATAATLTVNSTAASSFGTAGVITGALSLVKTGAATLTLGAGATYTYSGNTTINAGAIKLGAANVIPDGSGKGDVILGGGTLDLGGFAETINGLSGSGTVIGNIIATNISPGGSSVGLLTINGNLTASGTLAFDVNGPYTTPGTHFDQIVVNGAVDLTNATVTFAQQIPGVPVAGQHIRLIENDLADGIVAPTTPTEGTIISLGGNSYQYTNAGGSGNDLALIGQASPLLSAAYVDDDWAGFTNGQAIVDADPVAAGDQAATFGTNAFASVNAAIAAVTGGANITVNAGTYNEAVLIDRPLFLTLQQGAITFGSLDDTVTTARVVLNGVTLTVGTNNGSTSYDSLIVGSGALTKEGTGAFTLAGDNSYDGVTTINRGRIVIKSNTALGSTVGGTIVNGNDGANAALLELNPTTGITVAEPLTLNGNALGRVTLVSTNGANVWSGNISANTPNSNHVQLISNNTSSLNISGNITGTLTTGLLLIRGGSTAANAITGSVNITGGLAKTDAGTWTLGAAGKTYSWTSARFAAGTVKAGVANVLTTSQLLVLGENGSTNAGTFDLNGFNQSVLGVDVDTGSTAVSNQIVTNSSATAATLTIDTAGGSATYEGQFKGALNITKTGAGTQTLTGSATANTYTGTTTVSGGVLAVGGTFGGDGAIPGNVTINNGGTLRLLQSNVINNTSDFTINAGGTFDLNTFSDVIGNLAGAGTVLLTTGSTLSLDDLAGNTTFSGNITGGGALLLRAALTAGIQTLSGNNDYSGGTTIAPSTGLNGRLQAGSNTALGTGPVVVTNGATPGGGELFLSAGVNVANPLTISGGSIAGVGALHVPTGTATYSGDINITAGTNAGGHFATGASPAQLNLAGKITSSTTVSQRAGIVVYSGSGSAFTDMFVTGTIRLGANDTLPSNLNLSLGVSGAATMETNGFNQTLNLIADPSNATALNVSGGTLTITNGLAIDTLDVAKLNGVDVTGTLKVNGGNVRIGSGTETLGIATGTLAGVGIGTLDLTNAAAVTINVANINIGISGSAANTRGSLLLSRNGTNDVTATTAITIADSASPGNTGVTSTMVLGASTTNINTASWTIGRRKSKATVTFAAAGGMLNLFGATGSGSTANLFISDNAVATASINTGTLDLNNGTFNAAINQLVIGRHNGTAAGGATGTLIMGAGNVNAATTLLGAPHASGTSNPANLTDGILAINGGTFATTTLAGGGTAALGAGDSVVNLNGGVLQFGTLSRIDSATAGTGAFTFNFNGGTIQNLPGQNLNDTNVDINLLTAATHTFLIDANQTATIGGGIKNSGSLNKEGAGVLLPTGVNDYAGQTNINNGILRMGSAKALGSTAGGTVVANGAVLDLNGQNATVNQEPLTLNGAGISGSGALTNSSGTPAFFNGPISGTYSIGGLGEITLQGPLTSGQLTKISPNKLTLLNASAYSGGTIISDGTLVAASPGSLGTGSVTTNGGVLVLTPATTATTGFGNSGTGWTLNGGPTASGDVLTITTNTANNAKTANFNQRVSINNFTATFTYNNPDTTVSGADGFAFTLHNDPRALATVGGAGGSLGYAGIAPSAGVAFNIFRNNVSGVRYVQNGTITTPYPSAAPVGVGNGTPIDVTISYNGTTLTWVLKQGANTFTGTQTVDLAAVLGGTTAWLAFTGGTGGENATQTISNFNFTAQPAIYPNNLVVPAGVGSNVQIAANVVNPNVSVATFTLNDGGTLNLSAAAGTPGDLAYGLASNATNLSGSSTVSVANNGNGTGTLTLGALNDSGTAATLIKTGPGDVVFNSAAASVVNGTKLNIQTGNARSNHATALGTLMAVDVASGAALQIGASQTIGALTNSGNVFLNSNTLTIGSTNNLSSVFSGVIGNGTGTGNLAKAGTGRLELASANTYSGTTTVAGGTLRINNTTGSATGSGNVTLQSGTILEGEGTISGSVTAQNNAGINPGFGGDDTGTINTGTLNMLAGSTIEIDVDGTLYDQVVVSGDINLAPGQVIPLGDIINTPQVGVYYVVGNNLGANPISGFLATLPQNVNGTPFVFDNQSARIYYNYNAALNQPGTGNDIAILFNNNLPPIARNDSFAMNEDGSLSGNVLTNTNPNGADSDPENDPLSNVTLVGAAPPGAFNLQATGAFTYTPTANLSGNVTFQYTVRDPLNAVSNTATVTIAIAAVADQPNLTVASPATGNEDTQIPLAITSSLVDTDGSETLAIRISGVPTGATLSAGTNAGGGVWNLTAAQLSGLRITPASNSDADFALTVTATATDTGGVTAQRTGTINVVVNQVADAPTLTVAPASGAEDTQIALPITAALVDTDGSETLAIRISGVPTGVLLSAGTNAGSGNWDLTPAQLTNLRLTPIGNSDADFTLTATATSTEVAGGTAQSQTTLPVTVVAAADAPPLNVASNSLSGGQGVAIPLGLSAALVDTDGSESLAVTVTLPPGSPATIIGGSDPDLDGTWSIPLANVATAAIRQNPNSPPFDIIVRATSTEAAVDASPKSATTSATIHVTIINTPPQVNLVDVEVGGESLGVQPTVTVIPGIGVALVFSSNEPGTYSLNWGDGSTPSTGPVVAGQNTVIHVFGKYGTFQPMLAVRDVDGGTTTIGVGQLPIITSQAIADTGGVIFVGGTSASDRIVFQAGGGGVTVRINNILQPAFSVHDKIVALGGGGNDNISVTGSLPVNFEFYGGEGDDYLAGGPLNDLLDGGNGKDRLLGGNGDDLLLGGAGNDTLTGGNGNDTLSGDEFADLFGGTSLPDGGVSLPGDILASSSPGVDNLTGDGGDDTLRGGGSNDVLTGGVGNDFLRGNAGSDRLDGGAGNDLLSGDEGADNLQGRAGDDLLLGGAGLDLIYGSTGADLLFGGDFDPSQLDDASLLALWQMFIDDPLSAADTIEADAIDDHAADTVHGEADGDYYLVYINDVFKLANEKLSPNEVRRMAS